MNERFARTSHYLNAFRDTYEFDLESGDSIIVPRENISRFRVDDGVILHLKDGKQYRLDIDRDTLREVLR